MTKPCATAPISSCDPLFEAQECLGRIGQAHQASLALEHLVASSGAHDRQQIDASRAQLGSLLAILNENMARSIECVAGHLDEAVRCAAADRQHGLKPRQEAA
jgi:hypothetical protein